MGGELRIWRVGDINTSMTSRTPPPPRAQAFRTSLSSPSHTSHDLVAKRCPRGWIAIFEVSAIPVQNFCHSPQPTCVPNSVCTGEVLSSLELYSVLRTCALFAIISLEIFGIPVNISGNIIGAGTCIRLVFFVSCDLPLQILDRGCVIFQTRYSTGSIAWALQQKNAWKERKRGPVTPGRGIIFCMFSSTQ